MTGFQLDSLDDKCVTNILLCDVIRKLYMLPTA